MSIDPPIAAAIDRDRREQRDWHEGSCDGCGEELLVLDVDLPDYDELCLRCADDEVEDGDLTAIAAGAR